MNPATGRRCRRRLLKSGFAGVHDALAQRSDLLPNEWPRLSSRSSVAISVAANPATPREVIEWLRTAHDPFIRGLASVHPSLPYDTRMQVMDDSNTPRWVLRRCAVAADLEPDDRDRIQAWLFLGGGTGDPHFDPVLCTGTPGEVGQPRDQAYRSATRESSAWSALWYARALSGRGRGRLEYGEIRQLATDGHPAVRAVGAGYNYAPTLRALQVDVDERVRRRAEQTWAGLPSKSRSRLRSIPRRRAFPAAWLVAVAIVGAVNALPSTSSTNSVPPPAALSSLLQGLDQPTWTMIDEPTVPPDCEAGGNRVWVRREPPFVSVTVHTEQSLIPLTFRAVRSGFTTQTGDFVVQLFSRQTGQWQTFAIGTGHVEVSIGQSIGTPAIIPFDPALSPTFPDSDGDC